MHCRRVSGKRGGWGEFEIASSRPGHDPYFLHISAGGEIGPCSCEGASFRPGVPCRHSIAIAEAFVLELRSLGLSTPPPPQTQPHDDEPPAYGVEAKRALAAPTWDRPLVVEDMSWLSAYAPAGVA